MRGLRTKTSIFYSAVLAESYPIIVITESWLNDSFSSSEIMDNRYVVYRRDRSALTSSCERGGGVLVAVHKSLLSCELLLPEPSIEEIWVKVKMSECELLLCAVYIPPSSKDCIYSEHLSRVEEIVESCDGQTVIVVGDYNLSGVKWIEHPGDDGIIASCNSVGEKYFCDSLNFLNLSQYNFIYNHNSVLLDLVLCNSDIVRVSRSEPLVPLDNNHPALLITLYDSYLEALGQQIRYKYLYKKASYNQINRVLERVDWSFLRTGDIDACIDKFYDILYEIINVYVPQKRVSKSTFPAWVSVETRKLVYCKKEAHKRYKATMLHHDYDVFTWLRSEVNKRLENDKLQFVRNTEDNIIADSQNFWRYIGSLRSESGVPNSVTYNGRPAVGGQDVSNCFALCFESHYVKGSNYNLIDDFVSGFLDKIPFKSTNSLCHVDITHQMVLDALLHLKPKNSCGPDGIAAHFVYHCAHNLVEPLFLIYQRCLLEAIFPYKWKCSNVFPIYKSGPKSDVTNYRPVCLNSNFAKVFDHILSKVITEHARDFIVVEQHGFSEGKSTETNLFIFTNYIYKCMESGSSVDCIFTDLRKAFDRVPIDLLIFKLQHLYGISDPLLSCLRAYLSNRSQRVTINGHTSNDFYVLSGVGQGTHLGPILFTLFINDLKFSLSHCEFLLFADDCKLFKRIDSTSDQLALQADIDNFYNWCELNSLSVNTDKCKHLQFTRKIDPLQFKYSLNGTKLSSVSSFKDLGVVVDRKLSFNLHIDSMVGRASKLLGFITRNTRMFSNIRTLIILYLSFIRPIMEYCCVVWAPSYITHIKRLERIQRKFVKLLCFKSGIPFHELSYEYHLQYFSLPHLISRRKFYDIMFAFKVLNNIIKCPDIVVMFALHVPIHTLRKNRIFDIEYHRTNYGKHSSLVRVCKHTNDVNLDLFSENMSLFRRHLRALLL